MIKLTSPNYDYTIINSDPRDTNTVITSRYYISLYLVYNVVIVINYRKATEGDLIIILSKYYYNNT